MTESCYACILEYVDGKIITRAYGDMRDKNYSVSQSGMHACVDPEARCIALRLYDGVLKIINLNSSSKHLTSAEQRIEEILVVDMCFLHTANKPTLALLYDDNSSRHLSTIAITLDNSGSGASIHKGPFRHTQVEQDTILIVAVPEPLAGILLLGHVNITYHDSKNRSTCSIENIVKRTIECVTPIDKHRYLCGDSNGELFLLLLDYNENRIPEERMRLATKYLGRTTLPNTLSYIDNYVVFVGSTFGDSELIRIEVSDNNSGQHFTSLHQYDNLGPIKDMCIVDFEKQGQGQLVTASGVGTGGSLRIIRNGVGIHEYASIDLEGVKGLWALKYLSSSTKQDSLLLSFVGQTIFLRLEGQDVTEVEEIPGFTNGEQTMYAGNVTDQQFLQITEKQVRLIADESLKGSWEPEENTQINLCSVNKNQVLLGVGSTAIYLEINDCEIVEKSRHVFDSEIACVDISPLQKEMSSDFFTIGLWNVTVSVNKLPSMEVIAKMELGGNIIPRSVLLNSFGENNTPYLLVSIGDGALFYIKLNEDHSFSSKKRIQLGTQPTSLNKFQTSNGSTVFACSDRPAVIHSTNEKIFFSNVNLKQVNHMCVLDTEGYPNALALVNENALLIGKIDDIQKLHTSTIRLNETPHSVLHYEEREVFAYLGEFDEEDLRDTRPDQESTKKLFTPLSIQCPYKSGVVERDDSNSLTHYTMVNTLVICDEITFTPKWAHFFDVGEISSCMCIAKLGKKDEQFIVVGTAITADEQECKNGRICVFSYSKEEKLTLVSTKQVNGAVYSVKALNGNKIICAINQQLKVFEMNEQTTLQSEAPIANHITCVAVDVSKNGFILSADLMRSISVFSYKPLEGALEEIARDYHPNWMTAIKMIDDDNYIGAENSENIFICTRNTEAPDEEDRQQLLPTGYYHVGEHINTIVEGNLVMDVHVESSITPTRTFLMGSVSGYVGLLAIFPEKQWQFLSKLEAKMRKVIRGVGKIDHESWRRFESDSRMEDCKGFVDGDLIEMFQDLRPEKQKEVISELTMDGEPATHDDVVRLVDDLCRLH